MAERITNSYQRLFEVRILHHYWLDEGVTLFDHLPELIRNNRLLTYDVRQLFTVSPTTSTQKQLRGLGGIQKNTALGWIIAVPANSPVPDNALFEFSLTVVGNDLVNYTALSLPKRPITDLYDESSKATYRYKQDVPVFSNRTGASRGTGADKQLFLSKEIPGLTPGDRVESLIRTGEGALQQLTSDQPDATLQPLNGQIDQTPVFMHQADVEPLILPVGLTNVPTPGVPAYGVRLHDGIPDDVFALVRIAATRSDDPDFSCTTDKLAKANPPVFSIRLKNRSTIRQYKDKTTKALVETEAAPLPMTQFGSAGTRQQPSDTTITITFDPVIHPKITSLISEIFV